MYELKRYQNGISTLYILDSNGNRIIEKQKPNYIGPDIYKKAIRKIDMSQYILKYNYKRDAKIL